MAKHPTMQRRPQLVPRGRSRIVRYLATVRIKGRAETGAYAGLGGMASLGRDGPLNPQVWLFFERLDFTVRPR